jgi:hypothetical protein
MAAPFPPQGNQKQQTEKPLKVYAEQFLTGQPLPVGVATYVFEPTFPNGEPRVYTDRGVFAIHDTDWVISSRYTGRPVEVISAEEFAERFGPSLELA